MTNNLGSSFTFAYFTDTHVVAGAKIPGPQGTWEVDTNETLRQVVAALGELDVSLAFTIVGGDLVSPDLAPGEHSANGENYAQSYAMLRTLLSPIEGPVHLLLGNHDDRAAFHDTMSTGLPADATHDYAFDVGGCHFVALDSLSPGEPGGRLSGNQLRWLADDLALHRDSPTFLFVHHHPVPIGNSWMDAMGLHDRDALFGVLDQHPQVRWVFAGHVHQEAAVQRGHLRIHTTPSTCFQISPMINGRRILPGPPAFRLVTVDGLEVRTKVVYLHATGA